MKAILLAACAACLILLGGCNSNKSDTNETKKPGQCRERTRCFQGDRCVRPDGHPGPHQCGFTNHEPW